MSGRLDMEQTLCQAGIVKSLPNFFKQSRLNIRAPALSLVKVSPFLYELQPITKLYLPPSPPSRKNRYVHQISPSLQQPFHPLPSSQHQYSTFKLNPPNSRSIWASFWVLPPSFTPSISASERTSKWFFF